MIQVFTKRYFRIDKTYIGYVNLANSKGAIRRFTFSNFFFKANKGVNIFNFERVFGYPHLLYNKYRKINPNRGGSCIDSPGSIKKKKQQ